MCNLSWTPHSSLEKDNSLNHSCVSPNMGCIGVRDGGSGGQLIPQFGQILHLFGQKATHLFVTIRAKLGLTLQMDVGPYAECLECTN